MALVRHENPHQQNPVAYLPRKIDERHGQDVSVSMEKSEWLKHRPRANRCGSAVYIFTSRILGVRTSGLGFFHVPTSSAQMRVHVSRKTVEIFRSLISASYPPQVNLRFESSFGYVCSFCFFFGVIHLRSCFHMH